jgi:hypothetical protein
MNSRWRITKGRLYLFIPLAGLLILVMSLGGIRPAVAQNNLPLLNLAGDAVLLEDRLRLTADQEGQTGAAWLPAKQSVQGGFETTFQWQISRSAQEAGADGFAFVVQNASGLALGDGGDGIGYSGIANSLAVEFDTLQNPPEEFEGELGDPNDNHISVQSRGMLSNSADPSFSLGSTTTVPFLGDGNVHTAKVVYVPGTLTIFLDDLTSPVLIVRVDLGTTLSLDNGQAWVGFTAATGGRSQAHDILSFSFVGTEEAQPGVDIDIIPGSDPNTWPCQNTEEDLPVVILSTEDFDATNVDADSVRFGKAGTEASEVHRDDEGKAERHVEDVNGDGRDDLVFHFRFGDTGFSCDDIPEGQDSVGLRARLTGEAQGKPLAGEDALQLVRQKDEDPNNFTAQLGGDQEVPPRTTNATGQTTFHLRDETQLDFTLNMLNVENVVAAHIHCAPAGENGAVGATLYGPLTPGGGSVDVLVVQRAITAPDAENECGWADLAAVVEAMRSGNTYVNVHTDDGVDPPDTGAGDFPGGEIRGQIKGLVQ